MFKHTLAGESVCAVTREDMERFADQITSIPGCRAAMIRDEAGREIYRCRIDFDPVTFGMNAKPVSAPSPSIPGR